MYVEATHTWADANTKCGTLSGGKATLVSIHNKDENYHVFSLLNNYSAWIGGSITADGSGTWIDGSPFNYTNWDSGEPNGRQAEAITMYHKSITGGKTPGTWNDTSFLQSDIRALVCSYIP